MCNVNAELREISRCNAGGTAGCRGCTLNLSLGEEGLEDYRRSERWSPGSASQRNKDLRNLPETGVWASQTGGQVRHWSAVRIHNSERLHHIGNLAIDLRVEDPVAAANDALMALEWRPSKRYARSKIVLVRVQRSILSVQLVADSVVEHEIRPDFP